MAPQTLSQPRGGLGKLVTWNRPTTSRKVSYEIRGWAHESGEVRTLGKDILVIPGAINDFMEQLIEGADAANKWAKADVDRSSKVESDYEYRDCQTVSVLQTNNLGGFEFILKELSPLWALAYKGYCNPFMDCFGAETEWQLLRYQPGHFFKVHTDVIPNSPALNGRRLSVLFLHDTNSRGGALVFVRHGYAIYPDGRVYKWAGQGEQQNEGIEDSPNWRMIMKAAPGSVVLFPSCPSYPHEKQEITEGSAETLANWYH